MNHVIAIPDSAVIDCSDLRTKTEKIFQIARIAAIFQAKEILVYHDPFLKPSRADRERRVLTRILKYIECPQYLRKRLFPLSRDTAAVGVLSPLATPHHPRSKELKENEIREAAVFLNQNRAVADVGGPNLLEVLNPPKKSLREKILRLTIRLRKKQGKFFAEISPKSPSDKYWGYSVHSSSSVLGKLLLNRTEYKIATSRYCQPISAITIDRKKYNNLLVAFGGPYKGIPELIKPEGKKTNDIFDNCMNILQSYGTRSLRLEEAMMITFSKLEMIVK